MIMQNYNFIKLLEEHNIRYNVTEDNFLIIDGIFNKKYMNLNYIKSIDEDFQYNIYFRNIYELSINNLTIIPENIFLKFENIHTLELLSLRQLPNNIEFSSIYWLSFKNISEIKEEQKIILYNVNHIYFTRYLKYVKGRIYIKDKMPLLSFGEESIVSGEIYINNIKYLSSSPCGVYGSKLTGTIDIQINNEFIKNADVIKISFHVFHNNSMVKINGRNSNCLNIDFYGQSIYAHLFIEGLYRVRVYCYEFFPNLFRINTQILYFYANKIYLNELRIKTDEVGIFMNENKPETISGNGLIETKLLKIHLEDNSINFIYNKLKSLKHMFYPNSVIKFKNVSITNVNDNNILKNILINKYISNKIFLCFLKKV